MAFTVTPWEVSGDIDYDRLIRDFGIKKLPTLPDELLSHVLFRRGMIFAHRDFEKILTRIKDKKPFIMLTGLMPTGKMHLGHMVLAAQFPLYQKLGGKVFICVADVEAYTARGQSLEDSRRIALEEYIPTYIALGLKPEDCYIYFQSDRSKDTKRAIAYYQLQNLLSKHISLKEITAVYGDIDPGKIMASVLQAADILHPQLLEGKLPVVVPVGTDQDPHLRLTRDLAKRYKAFSFEQVSSTYHKFVPGLQGGKMSSSVPSSFISVTDDAATIKKKINKYAFSGGQETLEEHRKLGGNPDVDVAFQYLASFFEEDDSVVADLAAKYKSGELLSGEMKKIAIEKITIYLEDLQQKREKAKKHIAKYFD
jgi:tryptophanyl-tRNA synthetase